MSTTKEGDRDPYIGARVSEEFKRKAEMRARQKGMNMTEYMIDLIEQDLADAPYLDEIDFD